MAILEIKNIVKSFDGIRALDGVTLSFQEGAITSLIGPNGSGKTTLTHVLSGIHVFESGTIIFEGKSHSAIRTHQVASLGATRTFQEVRLFEQMSVYENIVVVLTQQHPVAALLEFSDRPYREQVLQILQRIGLKEKSAALAGELSYGQRKLLEIGRVLAMQPKIVFFDEPFAGLFPEMIKQVVSIMKELRANGVTQILIEHNMDLIRKLSDAVFVMDAGRVLAYGKPEEVLSLAEVLEAYLGG